LEDTRTLEAHMENQYGVGSAVEIALSMDMEIGSLLSNALSGTLRAANGNAGLPQGPALLVLGRWLLNYSCIWVAHLSHA